MIITSSELAEDFDRARLFHKFDQTGLFYRHSIDQSDYFVMVVLRNGIVGTTDVIELECSSDGNTLTLICTGVIDVNFSLRKLVPS